MLKMKNRQFIAFDLGATSGRTVLGTLTPEGVLHTEELTRFPNGMTLEEGRLYWDMEGLYGHLLEGLAEAARRGIAVESAGIDTWGVDVVYLRSDNDQPKRTYAYRDAMNAKGREAFFKEVMSPAELYGKTGIQHLDFNTVFQLYARRDEHDGNNVKTVMFIPDALSYMLTGEKVTEYTIASTGALLDPSERTLREELLAPAGFKPSHFAEMTQPGATIGRLKGELAEQTGCGVIDIKAVAGHDTASAVAAIPAQDENFAYLSSGTWSLIGVETSMPVINEVTERENITNEGGVFGTIRLLKNITGMWMVEQCLKKWKSEGTVYSYPEMVALAEAAPEFRTMLDPDDAAFVAPEDMPAAIDEYCRKHGQPVPRTHGEYIRAIFESLALKYGYILGIFRQLADHPVDRLHVIGGGSRNAFLNQMTANAIGLPVVAGPAEASAIGNIMMQTGCGSLSELRSIVARSVETKTFQPADQPKWEKAVERYREFLNNK